MAAIEFNLFAPYNTEAALIGEFSDWEDVAMEKGEDGYFRTEVDLEDGSYKYKFRVRTKSWFFDEDEWVDVVDPYATEVDDTETPNAVAHVKNGERIVDDYTWQHDDVPLPPDHQLVIYELHVGDFSGNEGDEVERGDFEDVVDKLDYLSDLGVNAVELMPVEEYPGEHSWGYNPRYFFAAESSYGSTEDLKRLIDACHERGIRVIKDGVYNHSESSAPLTQIDHDYWFHHEPRDPDNNWGPEFNYEKYDENLHIFPARKFVGEVVRYWASEYHLDGIRFDAARQMENFEFMHWVSREGQKMSGGKPFYTIAEYIPENPEVTGVDGPMNGCWHDSFYHTVTDVMKGNVDFEQLKKVLNAPSQGFPEARNVVNYLSNHDHNHVMAELGDAGILDEEAFKRVKLGAALLFTAVGVPLVWMGDEFGEYTYKTTEENKLNWGLLENDNNKDLRGSFKGLINLRTTYTALFGTNIQFFHEDPDAGVLAYVRWNDEGSRVVVVANLGNTYLGDYTVPNFPADGTWHAWVQDYDVEVHDGKLTLDLPEFEALVLVD